MSSRISSGISYTSTGRSYRDGTYSVPSPSARNSYTSSYTPSSDYTTTKKYGSTDHTYRSSLTVGGDTTTHSTGLGYTSPRYASSPPTSSTKSGMDYSRDARSPSVEYSRKVSYESGYNTYYPKENATTKKSKMGNLIKKVRASSVDYGNGDPPKQENSSPQPKSGSIYRRPSVPKPRPSNVVADVRRRQYKQNLMWFSHGDVEDIPIEAYLDDLVLDGKDDYSSNSSRQDNPKRVSFSRENSVTREGSMSREGSLGFKDQDPNPRRSFFRRSFHREGSYNKEVSPSVIRKSVSANALRREGSLTRDNPKREGSITRLSHSRGSSPALSSSNRDSMGRDKEEELGEIDLNYNFEEIIGAKSDRRNKHIVYADPSINARFNRDESHLQKKTLDDMYSFYLGDSSSEGNQKRDIRQKSPETRASKTRFNEDVNVIYYNDEEQTSTETSRNSVKLKEEKNYSNSPKIQNKDDGTNPNDGTGAENNAAPLDVATLLPDSVKVLADANQPSKKKLKIRTRISGEYIRNKTSVKALSGGLKLIVLLYKYDLEDDGEYSLQQVVKQLPLPHQVDAFGVRAAMDKQGHLNVEAPILHLNEEANFDLNTES